MGGWRGVVAASLFLAANACAPLVVQQGGRTVKPGAVQVGTSVGAVTSSFEDEDTEETDTSAYIAMAPNAWARFGLASNVDMGLQFYGSGARVDAKFAPVQSDSMAFAVCAGVGGGAQQSKDTSADVGDGGSESTDAHQWWGDVGLLFTAGLGPSMDLNVAAKYLAGEDYQSEEFDGDESKESTALSGFGGALGMSFKRGTWALSPEIAVYQITSTQTEVPDSSADSLVIVPSVGFSVGF